MKQWPILSTLASGVIVALAWLSGIEAQQNTPDIRNFLNGGLPIWVRFTTAVRGPDCKVDIIDNVDGTYVMLRRFIGYTKLIMSNFQQFLEAHLGSSSDGSRSESLDVMNVSKRGAAPTSQERLIYLSQNRECGIFEVEDLVNAGADRTYELRSKNPLGGEAKDEECLMMYNKTTKGKARRISEDAACEDILKGNDNLLTSISMDGGRVGLYRIMLEGYPISPATAFLQYFAMIPILRPTWELEAHMGYLPPNFGE
ncbi:uncharacterized protein LOC119459521 [Dermacentor silvarum]|uniref:uncharacterized protein LOC119459521 n=1 Tax=Dermacentor silvarum TaxID=543639 RepID=UPI002101C580|nr:uncharacterized protein LOC119459521 [Dermacentor silvarum]